MLTPALNAASIFSVIISWLSRPALLPPRISFIKRSPITWLASSANIIKECIMPSYTASPAENRNLETLVPRYQQRHGIETKVKFE
jgi:hypothetical protein